jgi:hypothetical protein
VRIALYFLNDAEKIAEIVKDVFILVKRASFPEPEISRRQKAADQKVKSGLLKNDLPATLLITIG